MSGPVGPLRHVKAGVRALAPYTLVSRRGRVKLNQNENPWDLPEAVKRRVLEASLARTWSRYPGFDPQPLREALAGFAGWRPDGVLAGNGSNELIQALLLVTVSPGTPVVVPEPTFTLYGLLTRLLGGRPVPAPLGPSFEYDTDALREARRASGAPLTIVCSPNNPTGGVLALDALEALCDEGDGIVVYDEAYHEFSGQTAVPLLARHPNLVVLRTFSKAMSLAGMRVGYLLASPDLVAEIDKGRLPYNLNVVSEAAALAAVEAWPELRERVARLVAERERLTAELARLPGLTVFPSKANFLLFELEAADPKVVLDALFAEGVLVRDVTSYPRLSRCLRLSVGSPEENDVLLASLRRILDRRAGT